MQRNRRDSAAYVIVDSGSFVLPEKAQDQRNVLAMIDLFSEPEGSWFECYITGVKVVLISQGDGSVADSQHGFGMLTFDQGDPRMGADTVGQTWAVAGFGANCLKGAMEPKEWYDWCFFLCKHYDPEKADAIQNHLEKKEADKSIVEMSDWEVLEAFPGYQAPKRKVPAFYNIHRSEAAKGTKSVWDDQDQVNRFLMARKYTCCVSGVCDDVHPISIDRDTNEKPHGPLNNVMSVRLNYAKGAHGAFNSQAASLNAFSARMFPGETLSNLQIIKRVFRPFLEQVIRRFLQDHPDLQDVLQLPECMR